MQTASMPGLQQDQLCMCRNGQLQSKVKGQFQDTCTKRARVAFGLSKIKPWEGWY